ncbi:MAG: peptidylprolyl isomerase, partial [Leptospiraceae bacterium]|nr:peptidylprolyl isomerase [Leptospiraceae bacterium]
MKVQNNTVVTFDYTLRDSEGNILDSSEGGDAFAYLHGHGQIIPGLENALNDKEKGDSFEVVVQPEDAYGMYDEELVAAIPREQFDPRIQIEPGMQFNAERNGKYYTLTVVEVQDKHIIVDGNHPLAGMV